VPLFVDELGPHLTQCGRTVWAEYSNVTDRQTGQDRIDDGLIAQGEPFYKWSPKKRHDCRSSKNSHSGQITSSLPLGGTTVVDVSVVTPA